MIQKIYKNKMHITTTAQQQQNKCSKKTIQENVYKILRDIHVCMHVCMFADRKIRCVADVC